VVKKIVISPNNTKAIAFFDELSKRKAELKKKLEERVLFKKATTRESR
jgi:hypothetical protein